MTQVAPDATKETQVPEIPEPTPGNLLAVVKAIKEVLDVREGIAGDPLDQAVTVRDLYAMGKLDVSAQNSKVYVRIPGTGIIYIPPAPSVAPEYNTPPAPTGFQASGAIATVILEWNAATYHGHAVTEVWRAGVDNLGQAVRIGTTPSSIYADELGLTGVTRYYWIRHVSKTGVPGKFNGTAGTAATTGLVDGTDIVPGSITPDLLEPDTTAPGAPTGLIAAAGFKVVVLRWLSPADTDIDFFEVYRNTVDDRATATLREKVKATVYADETVTAGTNYYYWVRAVDTSGNVGAYNALAGTSATPVLIQSADLIDSAVVEAKLASAAVTTAKLANLAVDNSKLAALAVDAAKLATNAVTTTKIADGNITTAKIGASQITTTLIADGNITELKLGAASVTETKIGSGAVTEVKIGNAAVTVNKIGDGAVTTLKIGNLAVTTGKLADLAVDSTKLADAAVGLTKFASNLRPVQVVAALPGLPNATYPQGATVFLTTDNKLYRSTGTAWTATVPTVDLSGQITSGQITDGAVTTAKIGDLQVVTTKIADGNITEVKLGAASVTETKIGAGAVTETKLGNSAVTVNKLADGAVTTVKIGDSQVTTTKIIDDAITVAKLEIAGATVMDQLYVRGTGFNNNALRRVVVGGAVYVNGTENGAAGVRGLNLCVIRRSDHANLQFRRDGTGTGTLAASQTYDVYASEAERLAMRDALVELRTNGNATRAAGDWGDDIIVIMTSADAWGTNTANGALLAAEMLLHGATSAVLDLAPARIPYALIGIPSIGEGRGIEVMTNLGATAPYAEYNGFVADGNMPGLGGFAENSISAALIKAGAIVTDKLAANAVTAAKIAAQTITAAQIATGTITANEIAAATITGAKIAAGTITASNLQAATITANEIAAATITGAKIAASTITGSNLAADTITAGNIAAGAISTSELAAKAITAEKLSIAVMTDNMVLNPGAEDGTSAWGLVEGSGAAFSASNTDKTEGDFSFKIADGPNTAYGTRALPLVPGDKYTIRVKVRGTAAAATGLYIRMNQAAAYPAGDYVTSGLRSGLTDFLANGPIPNVWTLYEFTYTVPAGVFWGSLSIYSWSATVLDLHWDEVEVRKQISAVHIEDGTIVAAKIAADTITATQIAAGAVTASELAANAVVAGKIAAGTIVAADIAADTITASQLAANAVTASELAAASVVAGKLAANAIVAGDGVIANAAIGTALIANAAITTALIGDAQVLQAKIADGSITNAKIVDATIQGAKIASATITNAHIASLAASKITAGTIAAAAVYLGANQVELDGVNAQIKINDTQAVPVTRVRIGKLGAGSTDYGIQIYNASGALIVGNTGLGSDVVNTAQIINLAVTNGKIAALAVDAAKIADATIVAAKIADATITGAKIGSATITGANIANATITNAHVNDLNAGKINAGTLDAARIAAASITADKLSVTTLSAITANLGDVTAGTLNIGSGRFVVDKFGSLTLQSAPHRLNLPGTNGNYASTPDSAANSITGDLEIQVAAVMTDWTPGATACLLAKWGAAGQRSYKLEVLTTGVLRLSWSADGTNIISKDSTVAPTVTNGAKLFIAVTLDVNNGAAGNDVKFYTGTDGVTHTQLGTTVTTAGVTSIFNSTSTLTVGAEAGGTTGLWAGKVYWAAVDDDAVLGGAPTAIFDSEKYLPGETSAVASTGETWTVHGTAAIEVETGSGARVELTHRVMKVYDEAGTKRVQIGDLSV